MALPTISVCDLLPRDEMWSCMNPLNDAHTLKGRQARTAKGTALVIDKDYFKAVEYVGWVWEMIIFDVFSLVNITSRSSHLHL